MRLRPFGTTGLRVSEIGFGCGPTAALMVTGDERTRIDVVARALALGINYFDTAPRYGDGLSEINLGHALAALSAHPVVATKVEIGAGDLADIATAVERSVEGSLKRLGRHAVDVVHLHNRIGLTRAERANIGGGIQLSVTDVLGPRGIAEGFRRLKRRGLALHTGLCAFGGTPAAVAATLAEPLFGSVLVNYSLINPSAWRAGEGDPDYGGVADLAAERGRAVVALRILEAGKLSGRAADGAASHFGFLIEDGSDLSEAAIRYVLTNPGVSTALVGISDAEQLETAVAAAKRGPLTSAQLDRIVTSAAR